MFGKIIILLKNYKNVLKPHISDFLVVIVFLVNMLELLVINRNIFNESYTYKNVQHFV